MGTLIRNTMCQELNSARTAPRSGPAADPTAMPRTLTESTNPDMDFGRYLMPTMNAEDASMAAPIPWTTLDTSMTDRVPESPHASEPTAKTTSPRVNTLLRAPASQTFPKIRISPAIIT